MAEQSRTVRPGRPAAGEAPEGLRHRLNDANESSDPETRAAGVDLDDLHATARDRNDQEPARKRRWRRA